MSEAAIQQVIASLVPEGARVLDLGCGDGALMQRLMRERGCTGYGIEIDDAKVLSCVQRGVNVLQLNLHEGLHHRLSHLRPLAQPPGRAARAHARHPPPALPVVRHAQHPRGHLQGL